MCISTVNPSFNSLKRISKTFSLRWDYLCASLLFMVLLFFFFLISFSVWFFAKKESSNKLKSNTENKIFRTGQMDKLAFYIYFLRIYYTICVVVDELRQVRDSFGFVLSLARLLACVRVCVRRIANKKMQLWIILFFPFGLSFFANISLFPLQNIMYRITCTHTHTHSVHSFVFAF